MNLSGGFRASRHFHSISVAVIIIPISHLSPIFMSHCSRAVRLIAVFIIVLYCKEILWPRRRGSDYFIFLWGEEADLNGRTLDIELHTHTHKHKTRQNNCIHREGKLWGCSGESVTDLWFMTLVILVCGAVTQLKNVQWERSWLTQLFIKAPKKQ